MSTENYALSTELQDLPLSVVPDEVFDSAVTSDNFLPRLQFVSSKASLASQDTNFANKYVLFKGKDSAVNLGSKIHITPIAYRLKAIDVGNKDAVVATTNFESELYKDIERRSEIKDSGCLVGPEYLVFIHGPNVFALLHLTSASAIKEATKIKKMLLKPILLSNKFIKTTKYSWNAIEVLAPEGTFALPEDKLVGLKDLVLDFNKFIEGPEKAAQAVRET